ncbi:ATP-dependent DNA helicase DinG [Bacillus rubiinfantis]|uniref:ATP-dependent DNA helicase DinG n=1 Tax=Bacillus rubiinfantis TaxID=1499680 RepID=UPI0005AB864C|nr:ATP-dependent DNA helicase DinG [Bacillus rubiinfantis]
MSTKFVVIDLETTGNTPKKGDKIIQFAAVVIEDGKITERFSSFLNPQKAIPIFIEELTGIHNEMVVNAPTFSEIASKVMELLEDAYFVAHNVLFDLSFLQEELIQAGYEGFYGPVLDTVEMARILYPCADGYKLSDLAELENLHHDRPHQADSDAAVTADLLLLLLNRLAALPLITLNQLLTLSGGLKCDLQLLLDEMLEKVDDPPQDDLGDTEIFMNFAIKKFTLPLINNGESTEYPYPENETEKLALVKRAFDFFEERKGQWKMMDAVYHAFYHERHALIEAGTGIGKSLSYLMPAAYFVKKAKQGPIVISTFTTQLQEQLLKQEVPKLAKMLPFKVHTVLLKGKSHYIDLEKFYHSLKDENDNYDTALTKMQILVWLTETETGDRDELNLSSGGLLYWEKIKSSRTILAKNQIWQERDYYLKAKREAEDADIIITNHALLLTDIKENYALLPSYNFAIIDEGHHFEKIAVQFFGASLDYLAIRLLIGKLGSVDHPQLINGLEVILNSIPAQRKMLISQEALYQLATDLNYEIDMFFQLLAAFAKKTIGLRNRHYRLKIKFSRCETNRETTAIVHSAERVAFLIKDLYAAISERLAWITKEKNQLTETEKTELEEIYQVLDELEELRNTFYNCFLKEIHDVNWIEIDTRSPQNVTTFMAQPVEVAHQLQEKFFATKKGVILTSASLAVNHSFDYIIGQLGLDPVTTDQQIISSPFDYQKQVQFFIPNDLPEINTVAMDEFVITLSEHIISIAEASKGRMMVLFTSYEMLKSTYDLIKESGFLNEYVLLAQGISSGSATRLLRNFKRYDKAILLGTSSFWEGVDIPGEDLSCLCIVRLPFSPPDEPLTEAKSKLILERGGNPFNEYALPEAVLRFKQGFGRLIRTNTDRGVIVVMDKRIVTTHYGSSFLNSIPPVTVKKGPISDLVTIIRSWV